MQREEQRLDPEVAARRAGLLAVTKLPLFRSGAVHVEIETTTDVWRATSRVDVDTQGRIVATFGMNGTAEHVAFDVPPRWRFVR